VRQAEEPSETWRIIADASIIRMSVENRQYRRSDTIVYLRVLTWIPETLQWLSGTTAWAKPAAGSGDLYQMILKRLLGKEDR